MQHSNFFHVRQSCTSIFLYTYQLFIETFETKKNQIACLNLLAKIKKCGRRCFGMAIKGSK